MSTTLAARSPVPDLGIFLLFGLVVASALGIQSTWARKRLDDWARENGVRILRHEWRLLLKGPYTAMGKYTVFRIWTSDESGRDRIGWVRLGGFWIGLWSPESQVIWEWEREAPPN